MESPAQVAIQPSSFKPLGTAEEGPKRARNPRRWAAITTALIFVSIMLFLLTARSLQIIVQAHGDAGISISGGLYLPFGDRYLLRPGEYLITATAPGYHPLTSNLTVTKQDSQTMELVLRPLPGKLFVDSSPPGAKLFIDGEEVGETPIKALSAEAGQHTVLLQAPRHLPLEQTLLITGRSIEQQLSVALEPAWADVSIASLPVGAAILVDGEEVGSTPAIVEIIQGERQLSLQKRGFSSWHQSVTISAGEAQKLGEITLQPASGVLYLSSTPSGANVTVDEAFRGRTPVTLDLKPNLNHKLAVFKPGYRPHRSQLQLAAGSSTEQTVKLVAELGQVRFNLSPETARLVVNGQPRGNGSQTLALPASEHTVEVSLEGHASVRRQVTPRPGLEQVVTIALQTKQAAKLARIQPEITTSLGQTLLLFTPGKFTMGTSRREPGRRANEVLHSVALSRMFYLQTTEVTNAQFRLFQSKHSSGQIEGNSLNREHQPVVRISWHQAALFCNWLSQREGLPTFYSEANGIVTGHKPSATGYRLATEAEWAWAARMDKGTLRKFTWGDSFPPTTAVENYADNTSAYVTGRVLNGYKDGHVASAAVASFPATHNGLYDIGGNVAEWVHDVYSIPPPNGATRVDPTGSQSGDNYVIRGASWAHSKIGELRLSYRDYGEAGRDDVGFRIARYAE
ncbi:MAG: PEGA domain-containing protein [Halieaceae bacterium]|nr:PEGA domain-containing protein [Halieaceae bacterium]